MTKDNIVRAIKEALRLVVFAIPAILIQVVSGDAALSAAWGGTILTVLKAIDRSVHDNPNTNLKGILPF